MTSLVLGSLRSSLSVIRTQHHFGKISSQYQAHVKLHKGAKQGGKAISLVIFDKDGTIIEYGTGWTEWSNKLTRCLETTTGITIENKLLDLFGYDTEAHKWREGLLCDTPENIKLGLTEFLKTHGMEEGKSNQAIEDCYKKVNDRHFVQHDVVPIDNPLEICKNLKQFNIKTALCTTDSRISTSNILQQLGLQTGFDYVLCGDDEAALPKPNPNNIYHICKTLQVEPSNAVMIGDTRRDVEMGKSANVGLNIGVLSGVCDQHELENDADEIVASISAALKLILPEQV